MEQKYDQLNGVGKRMPYNVPDGFFDTLEQRVMQEVATDAPKQESQPQSKGKVMWWVKRTSIAAAAALALVVGYKVYTHSPKVENFETVEQAFANLSEEDQDYLIEVYQEDIFMAEEEKYIDEI